MMPNRGASLWVREKVGSAAISTSHLVKLGSARIRTCRGTRIFLHKRCSSLLSHGSSPRAMQTDLM